MKVTITRTTFVAGKLLEAGRNPVELDDTDARRLIAMRKAVEAKQTAEPKTDTGKKAR